MKTRELAYTGILAALIAVCSWISIPTAVPFTLQTFAVFLTLGLLGGRLGTLAVTVYLLLGAVGLPVFAGFHGGLGAFLGATGGYLVGFLFTALTMWGAERGLGKSAPVFLGSAVVGQILCYLFGSVWYYAVYTSSAGPVGMFTVLGWCVFPFLLPDAVKLALAWLLSRRLAPALRISRR